MSAARPPGRPKGGTAKGDSTRQHIIDTAAVVFADLGYDKARINTLIAATGMTKGAVYFHFDSKEALALAVLEDKHRVWIADIQRRLDAVAPGPARLRALLPAMLALHRDDPSTWAISTLTRHLAEVESTRSRSSALTRRWVDLVAELIRDCQRLGHTPADVDARSAATVLTGAFDGVKAIHDTLAADTDQSFSATAELLDSMALAYLLPAPD